MRFRPFRVLSSFGIALLGLAALSAVSSSCGSASDLPVGTAGGRVDAAIDRGDATSDRGDAASADARSATLKTDGATSSADSATTLPACTWPSSFDVDGAATDCGAARALVVCGMEGGPGCACISDNPNQCTMEGTVVCADLPCHDVCAPNEYGLGCSTAAPPTCRMVFPTPGGLVFYCCPCGS